MLQAGAAYIRLLQVSELYCSHFHFQSLVYAIFSTSPILTSFFTFQCIFSLPIPGPPSVVTLSPTYVFSEHTVFLLVIAINHMLWSFLFVFLTRLLDLQGRDFIHFLKSVLQFLALYLAPRRHLTTT